VVFAIKNADGTAVDGNKLTSFSPKFAGPTASYGKPYFSETAAGKSTFDPATGNTTYTFTNAVPADASGTWTVTADIYRTANLVRSDGKEKVKIWSTPMSEATSIREAAMNPIANVAVTGTLTPRRQSVAISQCNVCHDKLALHGGQRQTTLECVICHNPVENDGARRPTNAGQPESVSFQRLIHRIHSGEELTQDFTIYGFGGTPNNFNEVRFPGDRRNCAKCHVNAAAYSLPLATGIASVNTPRDYFSPQGPGTAACLGCHDNKDAAAHAFLNTANFPGSNTPAEACATCHGTGKDWAVDKVHAR
jgi:OmcA/MtrC family decaheme c-type cytochrome